MKKKSTGTFGKKPEQARCNNNKQELISTISKNLNNAGRILDVLCGTSKERNTQKRNKHQQKTQWLIKMHKDDSPSGENTEKHGIKHIMKTLQCSVCLHVLTVKKSLTTTNSYFPQSRTFPSTLNCTRHQKIEPTQ